MSLHLGFSTTDLIRSNRVTQNEIDCIRDWNEAIQDLPLLTDEQIVVFLLRCERNIEFTQKTIKKNFKHKLKSPEIFDNRDIDGDSLQKVMDLGLPESFCFNSGLSWVFSSDEEEIFHNPKTYCRHSSADS